VHAEFRRGAKGDAAAYCVRVEEPGAVRLEIPAWMLDRSVCAGLAVEPTPRVSGEVYRELRRILAEAGCRRGADGVQSPDLDQGDPHAEPSSPPDHRATPPAAAAEPVRPASRAAVLGRPPGAGSPAMSEKITAGHLGRRAILYIRQSSAFQVEHNQESPRLQYAMEQRLRELGWTEVEVIDEDLGRSAAGGVDRTGFQRMVAGVCLGQVGAVAAREVSRFARNSRDWQQLVEVCRLVDTLLIDHETIYDARKSNDRLLLGLKGSLNEYELDLLRQRSWEARRQKAARGELIVGVPTGFVRDDERGLAKDPDRRVRHAIELVYSWSWARCGRCSCGSSSTASSFRHARREATAWCTGVDRDTPWSTGSSPTRSTAARTPLEEVRRSAMRVPYAAEHAGGQETSGLP